MEDKLNWKRMRIYLFYFLIIFIFVAITNYPFLRPDYSYHTGDWRTTHQPMIIIMQQAMHEGTLPLWTETQDAGTPYFAIPDKPFLYVPMLFLLTFLSPVAALNYSVIFHLFLAGIFMFLLADYIFKNKKVALISALIFVFNPRVIMTPPAWQFSITWMPLIFLFAIKCFKEDWKKNSIFLALAMAMQYHAGGVFIVYFFGLMLGFYFIYRIIFFKQFKKAIKISFIVGLILFGLVAIRLLPTLEWTKQTSRAQDLSVEQSIQKPLTFNNFFGVLIKGEPINAPNNQIGILAILLASGSILYFKRSKKSIILFFWLVVLGNLFFTTGIGYSLWIKLIPGLGKQHGVMRSLVVYIFAMAILAGYGFDYLIKKYNKKWILPLVAILIFIEFTFLSLYNFPDLEPYNYTTDNYPIIHHIAKQPGYFRMHIREIHGIDYNDALAVTIPLNLSYIYSGYGGIWIPEYFHQYLSLSQYDPAKIWGILNVKYVTSSEEWNVSGLKFVDKFEEYDAAWPEFADGPYLYENEKMLPRAFFSGNKIRIDPNYPDMTQIMQYLLIQSEFDSLTTVIVADDNDRDYDAVITNGFSKKIKITDENIKDVLKTFNKSYDEVPIIELKQNSMKVNVTGKSGILTVSEKYHMFPGWKAYVDGKKTNIMRTDFIISSIHVPDNSKEVEFIYFPDSFKKGLILFILTIVILVNLGGYYVFKHCYSSIQRRKDN
jgi:hypothetical protein